MSSSVSENIRHPEVEHALIGRIQSGDAESFAKLYDKYAPVLHGVILKIVRDEKHAEEILQKSFMRFWMEMNSFDPMKESLLIWMLNITRSMSLSAVPQKVKNEPIQNPDNTVNTLNPELTPIKTGTANHSTHYEQQVSVLEMVYFKGYSLTLAACELNITVDVLKTRLRMEFKMQGGEKSNG
jgi:RNA polymerase sigma-70 factor (ECF subfamily)